jgi:hypothetical protein
MTEPTLFSGFSLTCVRCDAGEDIDTEAQAVALGWINVMLDDTLGPDEWFWTHTGLCPDSQVEDPTSILR